MAFSPFHSATTRFTTFSRLSLGHSFSTTSPVQTKKNLLTPVTLSVETLGTYLLAKVKKSSKSAQITTLQQPLVPVGNGCHELSQLGRPIYPFLNQNLFFFFAASATFRQPRRSTHPHTASREEGGCWHHILSGVMDP